MRHLLLLRHAEAEAPRSSTDDFERPLTERGRDQARNAAERLRSLPPLPDMVLVSPAVRTRETAELIRVQLALGCEPLADPSLYLAGPDALLAALHACPLQHHCVLLIAHNPGLSALVRTLAQREAMRGVLPGDPGSFELPTAGLCRLQVDSPAWRQLAAHSVVAVTLVP